MQIWREGKMRIGIKDKNELKLMRESGRILGLILHEIKPFIVEGATGLEIDAKAEALMKKYRVDSNFKGYHGFPNVCCVNINDQVVHGIPTDIPFKNGDIVTVDCGVIYKGFHSDSAIQVAVGNVPEEVEKFLATAEKALQKAIKTARAGIRVGEISGVIEDIVEEKGYGIVRDLIGHGIGTSMHEDPPVPNFRDRDAGPILQVGMTIAIEPIITMGKPIIKLAPDEWTYTTADGSLATQVEHTIAITEKGAEILTKRPE